jgi:hypothetical protein
MEIMATFMAEWVTTLLAARLKDGAKSKSPLGGTPQQALGE